MIKIRKATMKDLNSIAELMKEYDIYENKLDKKIKISSLNKYKSQIKDSWKNKTINYTFIECNNLPVGLLSWSIDKRGLIKIGVLQDMIIKKEFRGQGLGKSLVNYVIQIMKKNNCKFVKSFARINNKNALKFWKKMGFNIEEVSGYVMKRKVKK